MPTPAMPALRAAILTVSDRCAAGLQQDESGPALRQRLAEAWPEMETVATAVVPDEAASIQRVLRAWADDERVALILTTGGTGFAPRDRTPEAVRPLLDRAAPGLVQAMLAASLSVTPYAMLSRPVAGMRGPTLIVTLPGSPKGAVENLDALLPALPHGLRLLHEEPTSHTADEIEEVGHS